MSEETNLTAEQQAAIDGIDAKTMSITGYDVAFDIIHTLNALVTKRTRERDALENDNRIQREEMLGLMRRHDRMRAERDAANERAEALAAVVAWWNDVEARAAEAHAVYQTEARRRGDVRHKDAYEQLDEPTKEWDRVLVRWVARTFTNPAHILAARDALVREQTIQELVDAASRSGHPREWLERQLAAAKAGKEPDHA